MPDQDVLIVGAGVSGCIAGALLAKHGKRITVVEGRPEIGGRAAVFPYGGYKLLYGGHLLEDTGTGVTAILRYLGKELEEGEPGDALPVWTDGRWRPVQDYYARDRGDLKKIIAELEAMDYGDDMDALDHLPLRTWLAERTSSPGIRLLFESLAMAECLTENWWDHAASDNLWMRKSHYTERGRAGWSHVPEGGFERIYDLAAEALTDHGGRILTNRRCVDVIIEGDHLDSKVTGIEVLHRGEEATPNEYATEVLEAPIVISTLPVWNVPSILDLGKLPAWFSEQIRKYASLENRSCWLGMYVGSKEPIHVLSPRELTAWWDGPVTGRPGWSLVASGVDPTAAPEGESLLVTGVGVPGPKTRDAAFVRDMFERLDRELALLFPNYDGAKLWTKRHVVTTFAVAQRPGMVGRWRPPHEVPGVEGLFFAGETFQSRGVGIDRAAQSALSTVDRIIGRVQGLDETWRY